MSQEKSNEDKPRTGNDTALEFNLPPLPDLIPLIGKLFVFLVGGLYVFGFIAINAHLSKYGYFDYQLANPRFLYVGGIVAVYFLCWFLFAGRAIIVGKKAFSENVESWASQGIKEPWTLLLFLESQLNVLFFICLSTGSFGFIAFDTFVDTIVILILVPAFLINYIIDVSDYNLTYPRMSLVATIVWKVIFVTIFIYFSYKDNNMITLFFIYFAMSAYINLFIDSFERKGVSNDKIIFTIGYTVFFILSSVVFFGYTFYGETRQKIGGGEAVPVEIVLNGKDNYIPWDRNNNGTIKGDLIYSGESDIILSNQNNIIMIKSSNIQAILIGKKKELSLLDRIHIVRNLFGIQPPNTRNPHP